MSAVHQPSHYTENYPFEVKEVIELILNSQACEGLSAYQIYCLGNELKYRFRAGFKGDLKEDIEKALVYKDMREDAGMADLVRL